MNRRKPEFSRLSVMLCVDLGCIGLCSLGPQELSWAIASICQAYPLGLEGLNRRKSRTERLYGMAATLWVQLWGSCVALPLLWLNFKLPAVLCCGPAVAKLTFLSILNRRTPDTIWPGFGRLLLKCFWDAPLLLISYAADTVLSSILPWPFFFNGKNGELVSDINTELCMGGRPLARHVARGKYWKHVRTLRTNSSLLSFGSVFLYDGAVNLYALNPIVARESKSSDLGLPKL